MQALKLSTWMTPGRRRVAGTVLHVVSTQFYLIALGVACLAIMEIFKGVELLHKIHNPWFTFGGARELFGYAVLVFIAGRLIDVYSKRLHPRLKHNPERGWHYPH